MCGNSLQIYLEMGVNEGFDSKGKFDTLYNWIYNEILKMIVSGQIKVNEQLPSEGELAERFGVSKMTSKLALNAVVDEGIIYRVPRKGSFLADVDINKLRNMIDAKGVNGTTNSRTNFLALIIPNMDNFCGSLAKEIVFVAEKYGYQVVLKCLNSESENLTLGELAKMPEIKGVILFPSDFNSCNVIWQLDTGKTGRICKFLYGYERY